MEFKSLIGTKYKNKWYISNGKWMRWVVFLSMILWVYLTMFWKELNPATVWFLFALFGAVEATNTVKRKLPDPKKDDWDDQEGINTTK